MIFLLVTAFVIIALLEVPGLIREKSMRELTAFIILLFIAFTLSLLQTIGVGIPSPYKAVLYLVRDVLYMNYQ